MGVVYKARQRALDRVVALKIIRSGAHAGAEERARFLAEARAAARLQHPNIVQVFEVGEHAGEPHCVLEYVAGSSLRNQLAEAPLSPRQAAELVQALARAVYHAHVHGVVHRDLKPGNVLLAAGTLAPKVADFGLAKRLDEDSDQTRTGAILGTPTYMAPEQAAGRTKEVGPAADIYGLGVILYECLTGRPPFRGASVQETLEQVRTREPVSPRLLQPGVPSDLETICLKCLQKEPPRRYATAEELGADLGRFLVGEPIRARPVGRVERAWRWCRRNPWVAVAGLATAAFTIIAVCVLERAEAARHLQQQRAAVLRQLSIARAQAESAINKRVFLTLGLKLARLCDRGKRSMRPTRHAREVAVK
jgi:serine/threonine protein kinase